MLFNSLEFLIFLPIVFLVHWIMPSRWRWIPLLCASYFFYMYWNPKLVFLIFFTTAVSYACGLLLSRFSERKTIKKLIIVSAMLACLGVLVFFKYFNFLYDAFFDVSTLFGGKPATGYFSIMLPVGISFYTFQTLSYVIDVYRKREPVERHFGYFALFVSFFPQLVAGPIERPGALLPQLHADRKIKDIDYIGAFRFMMVGFFKKIAVADAIGIVVNNVYENAAGANGLSALIATALFTVQIYCDFSGYSDIAVGCAKLFGVNLTENFHTPYVSRSIKEFWNRWHRSLSLWLRDYIYFPLGGSRVSSGRWIFNILVVFFVSGLWHGANYTFVVWGLLHAAFQIIGKYTLPVRDKVWQKLGKAPEGKLVSSLRCAGTCLLVGFAWIFFRADTISDAGVIIAKIAGDYSLSAAYLKETTELLALTLTSALYVVFALTLLPFMEKLKYPSVCGELGAGKARCRTALRFAAYILMVWSIVSVWIFLQASDVGSSFIYFQF